MTNIVECKLCPRACRLKNGERGNCRARINLDGKLYSLTYGTPCAVHVDPIEKKPFYHVLPGSKSFSIATAGCNLHCKYCQNWEISQRQPEEVESYDLPPEKVVEHALSSYSKSIAYTYSDPVIFYEYTYDTCKIAKQHNLLNLMVTAGYINPGPLSELCAFTDAANIDIKGITEDYYKNMSEATLKPVQDCIITMIKKGVWVELTNLIVPTWNDKPEDIEKLSRWVFDNCGPDTPLHFSRFWPMHKLQQLPPTPLETLNSAWEIAKKTGLKYVYIGNIPNHPGNNTYCPKCGDILIERQGYSIIHNKLQIGTCPKCQYKIPGLWQ